MIDDPWEVLYTTGEAAKVKGVPQTRILAAAHAGLLKHTYRLYPSGRTLLLISKSSLEKWDGELRPQNHMFKPLSKLLKKYGVKRDYIVDNFLRTGRVSYVKVGGRIFVNEEELRRVLQFHLPEKQT